MGDTSGDTNASGWSPERVDKLFARMAVSGHFVAHHHVNECLSELRRRSRREKGLHLADILVKRQYITNSQRETIESFVRKELGPERIGRYDLIDKIGEGGMGTVYRAKDSSSGRVVALKVLPPNLAQDKVFMGRFQREALAVTQLDHPNIVRGLDVGSVDDSHFIAMEFIEGLDCDKMLARRGRIPEQEAARIGAQIASAIGYAHKRKLVHRDIKPANIIVTPDGTAKLTDLGLAKSTSATAAKLTQAGITMGTPHYISPEQAMGSSDLDIRSDQYSLGATLYQLVTGRVPFEGSSPAIIVAKHLTEELENPQDVVPELSEGMTLVLEKMLAKERDDRYNDPEDLVADLSKVAEGRRPDLVGLEAGKSTIMKSADIREAAARLARKRRRKLFAGRGSLTLAVGIALGLGVAVGVIVLLAWLNPDVVDRMKEEGRPNGGTGAPSGTGPVEETGKEPEGETSARPREAAGGVGPWTPLLHGEGMAGWQSLGARGWGARASPAGGFIEGTDPGEGLIETRQVMGGYRLRAEFAASEGAEAWLVLGKLPLVPRGGARFRLPTRGASTWLAIEATVEGTRASARIVRAGGPRRAVDGSEGKPLAAESGTAAPEGVVAFEARKGTLRFRNVSVRRLAGETPPKE